MNIKLLQQVRKLRYKPLYDLIGNTLIVTELDNLQPDLVKNLGSELKDFSLVTGRDELLGCLGKYGFLDVTLASEGQPLDSERPCRALMSELGFFNRREREAGTKARNSGPACLSELLDRIDASRVFMRLLLSCDTPEIRHRHFVERWKRALETSADFNQATINAFDEALNDAQKKFPATFTVEDACFANSDFVWFHKYFWM